MPLPLGRMLVRTIAYDKVKSALLLTMVGNDGQAAGGIPATLGFEWLPSSGVVEKAEEA